MSTIIAASTITDSNTSGTAFVPSGNFFVVCSKGAARLEVRISGAWYGVSYQGAEYTRTPKIKQGSLLQVTRLEAGATYRLVGDPTLVTTASAWNL